MSHHIPSQHSILRAILKQRPAYNDVLICRRNACAGALCDKVGFGYDLALLHIPCEDKGTACLAAWDKLTRKNGLFALTENGVHKAEVADSLAEILGVAGMIVVVSGQRLVKSEVLFDYLCAEKISRCEYCHGVVGQCVVAVAYRDVGEYALESRYNAQVGVLVLAGIGQHAVQQRDLVVASFADSAHSLLHLGKIRSADGQIYRLTFLCNMSDEREIAEVGGGYLYISTISSR